MNMKPSLNPSRQSFLRSVVIAAAAVALGPGAAWAQTKTVKLGLSAPITGDQAQYGADFRRGLELAVETVNRNNVVPGVRFEVVVEDSKSDPKEAANVAQKFASNKEVLAIVGDFSSTAVLASAPIYQKAKIIMLTPTASHPDITKTGDYIFRNALIAELEAGAVADWATKDMKVKSVAIIGRNDDYGRVQSQFFSAKSKANGANVVATEFINPADKDFKPLITALRAKNPEVTLLAMFQVEAAMLMQQAKEMGFKTTFMSGASLFNPQLLTLAGDTANGTLLVSSYFAGSANPVVQSFVKAFKDKHGTIPSKFSAHAYDAVGMIADAVRRAGSTDTAAVRNALAATKGYKGVIGDVSLDANREVVLDMLRLQVANKDFVLYKP
jgi:branched-chain amino acid transport system substrate-binding protein